MELESIVSYLNSCGDRITTSWKFKMYEVLEDYAYYVMGDETSNWHLENKDW